MHFTHQTDSARKLGEVIHLRERKHCLKTFTALQLYLLMGKALKIDPSKISGVRVPQAVCGCIQQHLGNSYDDTGNMCIDIYLFHWTILATQKDGGGTTAWVKVCSTNQLCFLKKQVAEVQKKPETSSRAQFFWWISSMDTRLDQYTPLWSQGCCIQSHGCILHPNISGICAWTKWIAVIIIY